MSGFEPQPDPQGHWADHLAEEAGRQWRRQHRLRSLWLRLQQRLQGRWRQNEQTPSDGRGQGLLEPVLETEESERIRRAWLEHTTAARQASTAERISRTLEQLQRREERWRRGQISTEELEQLHQQRAADEQMQRQLTLLIRVATWLLR